MTQTNKYYRFDGMKAVSLWGDEGWVTSNSGPAMELSDLVNHVPWLYRAVDLVADRASTVPFAIVNKSRCLRYSSDPVNVGIPAVV